MSSITRLQDALLQLEDHLCRAGTALVRAEQEGASRQEPRRINSKKPI